MLRLLGLLFVGLGFIGILLPLVPTTPFLLLAAMCFAKSSPAMHAKLMNNPIFGPILQDWEDKRCVSPQIKIVAITSVVVFAGFSVLFVLPGATMKSIGLLIIAISIFAILRIPTCPNDPQ
ncbi:Inner membrane protein YbaN [BD1-7 clade bacterium]|uniref:Inner membrane protein n=1 Tax=BD1-7 clade bacterium TaxID=2029982 RepID=A0A5S9QF03_9GAMM|nr:Inner membrane protein YbaN [BD1-7 clade bacterium]CAA0117102.1 Inner membrane protein YbaN [BD1-7 clade bacterium]